VPKAKVLLLDDHPLLRQGLAQLINQENDLIVCGEAEDWSSAIQAVQLLAPDIAIVDLMLKNRDGGDVVRQLAQACPGLRMLVFSMHDEWLHAERALQSGARGYVMKNEPPGKVLEAMRHILAGEIHLSERMLARLRNRFARVKNQEDSSPSSALSHRELQIFTMIGQGNSSREIAESLSVSIKTVETHRERIKNKLDLKNAIELLRYAMRYTQNL